MTSSQRLILSRLFNGLTMRRSINHNGAEIFKLYDAKKNPDSYILASAFGSRGAEFLKKDRKGNYSLDLRVVRRQHGNSWVKKEYKERLAARLTNSKTESNAH